ncbi:hypothetical protein C8J56DRAFT_953406 [Mycena floridula]|nr:hypothetical protein C8J56DRAFT_953406 [Mycena floridula]
MTASLSKAAVVSEAFCSRASSLLVSVSTVSVSTIGVSGSGIGGAISIGIGASAGFGPWQCRCLFARNAALYCEKGVLIHQVAALTPAANQKSREDGCFSHHDTVRAPAPNQTRGVSASRRSSLEFFMMENEMRGRMTKAKQRFMLFGKDTNVVGGRECRKRN